MSASAFQLYNSAKTNMMDGTTDLNSNLIVGYLFQNTSNASTTALVAIGSVTNAVSGGGYTGRHTLDSPTVALSGDTAKWDVADEIWTASSGAISNVMYLVIAASGASGTKLVCWSKLSTAAFNVSSGNTLTVQFASNGVFGLT